MSDKQKELNQRYMNLCVKLGDVEAKLMFLSAERSRLKELSMNLKSQINELNKEMNEVLNEANKPA